ncbi:MAG: TonB-dependent receptor [Acetobacterales bacterium]
MRPSIPVASLAMAVAVAADAHAQQSAAQPEPPRIPVIEIYAPRIANPVERIPADISVIDTAGIENDSDSTLEEGLRDLPGTHVVRAGGPGNQTSLFTRGTESDHTLVLFNGLPVNDPSAPGGAYTFGSDLLAGFDRVEFLRGPMSSYYGSGAIGGVINQQLRPGGPTEFQPSVDIAGGNRDTWRGRAGVRGTVGRMDYVANVAGLSTGGDNASPDRITSNRGEEDGSELRNATAAVDVDLGVARVDFAGRLRRTTFDLDDIPNDDPNYTGSTDHYAWTAGIERDLFDDQATVRLSGGESYYERGFENLPDSGSVKLQHDVFESRRRFGEASATWRFGGDSRVVVGGTLTDDTVETQTSLDSGSGPFTQAADVSERDGAVFASADIGLTDRIDVSAGLRREIPETYEARTTWRVGGVLHVDEWRSRFHVAAGTAFKAPTLFDRFGANNFGFRGNPDLQPEESRSFELGVDTDFTLFGHRNGATIGATAFVTEIENLIETDFTLNTTVNRDEAEIRGIETEATLRPVSWAVLAGTYTFVLAKDERSGNALNRRPRHKVAVEARLQATERLRIVPEVIYVGDRADVTYADSGTFLNRNYVEGYALVNLDVSYSLKPGVSVYGEGRNLTDKEYEPLNGVAGRGATVLVGVRASF